MSEEPEAKAVASVALFREIEAAGAKVIEQAMNGEATVSYWISRAQAAERKEQVTRRALEMACQDDWKLAWGEGGRPMWCLAQTSCPEGVSHGECGARYYLRKAADEFNQEGAEEEVAGDA